MKHGLLIPLLLSILLSPVRGLAQSDKPFTIPEVKSWSGTEGSFHYSDLCRLTPEGEEAAEVAVLLRQDLRELLSDTAKTGSSGTISLAIRPTLLSDKGSEAYLIEILPDHIALTGNSRQGLYWATRTLLQLLEQGEELSCGVIEDYPDYPIRGFMLDVGRKFFSLGFLRATVKLMAYYKMNAFHIHLNDNGFKKFYGDDWDKTYAAFRLESETHPGLTAMDGHYSKADFKQLQLETASLGVTIIPEIDVPAHTLAFTHYMPSIGSKEYGADHMDLFSPDTYRVLDDLLEEYLDPTAPTFISPYVHIGTDEYSNRDSVVVEQFRAFTDRYIRKVEDLGKKAAVWGSLSHARGKTPVKVDDVLLYCWSDDYAKGQEMIDLGYDIISIPDGWVYIVPAAGYYYDYLNIEELYKKWTPATVGRKTFEEHHPQIKGGMFAVWNDHCGNGISQQDVYHRIFPAMQTIAAKNWQGKSGTVSYETFDQKRRSLSEAPGVNLLARPEKGKRSYFVSSPKVDSPLGLPITEIGYDYRVSFRITPGENPRGTVLFASKNAIVYLSTPEEGMLGFERDGYRYHWDYRLPIGRETAVTIEGTNRETRLYIDGQLQETLGIIVHPEDRELKGPRYWVQTLVFPLERTGRFSGRLSDLRVEWLSN